MKGGGAKRFSTGLCRIDVGACYTRGARSRRWGRRGGLGGGGSSRATSWMARKIMR